LLKLVRHYQDSALSILADLKEDMDGNILNPQTPESWPIFWLKFKKYAKGLGQYHLLTEDGSKAAKLKDSGSQQTLIMRQY
jgi:hypothetical protein